MKNTMGFNFTGMFALMLTFGFAIALTGCDLFGSDDNDGGGQNGGGGDDGGGSTVHTEMSVQDFLDNNAKTEQESESSPKLVYSEYNAAKDRVELTYKLGTIKNVFLQYITDPWTNTGVGKLTEVTYTMTKSLSLENQVTTMKELAVNVSEKIGIREQVQVDVGVAVTAEVSGEFGISVTAKTAATYSQKSTEINSTSLTLKYDMSDTTVGCDYAFATFSDVDVYQVLKYDSLTKTALPIEGASLWFALADSSLVKYGLYQVPKEQLTLKQLNPYNEITSVEVDVDELIKEEEDEILYEVMEEGKEYYIQTAREGSSSNKGFWDLQGYPQFDGDKVRDLQVYDKETKPDRHYHFVHITSFPGNWYKIVPDQSAFKNASTTYVIDVGGGNFSSGVKLQSYEDNNTTAQRFRFKKVSGGTNNGLYRIYSYNEDFVISVSSSANSTDIKLANDIADGGSNVNSILWRLVEK